MKSISTAILIQSLCCVPFVARSPCSFVSLQLKLLSSRFIFLANGIAIIKCYKSY